jgi:hypothetical protein
MVFSCNKKNILTFLNKEGVELFQMGKGKIGSCTFDTLYIKEDCVVQFVSECCYVKNVTHLSVNDITCGFITEV